MSHQATGLAGGLIVTALLDKLMSANVLSKSDVRDILKRSMDAIGPDIKTPAGYEASQIIAGLLSGKFSERS